MAAINQGVKAITFLLNGLSAECHIDVGSSFDLFKISIWTRDVITMSREIDKSETTAVVLPI